MNNLSAALLLVNSLLESASKISEMVARATSEGRTVLTPDEWDQIGALDDASRKMLQSAIDNALKQG